MAATQSGIDISPKETWPQVLGISHHTYLFPVPGLVIYQILYCLFDSSLLNVAEGSSGSLGSTFLEMDACNITLWLSTDHHHET